MGMASIILDPGGHKSKRLIIFLGPSEFLPILTVAFPLFQAPAGGGGGVLVL